MLTLCTGGIRGKEVTLAWSLCEAVQYFDNKHFLSVFIRQSGNAGCFCTENTEGLNLQILITIFLPVASVCYCTTTFAVCCV